ncbi:pyruvate kinase [Bacteroidota bacterium]
MKKKTKIVATISDRNCDVEFIDKLYNAGMDVVRLNTAHQTIENTARVVENIRKVSDKIAILIDTKGPEIRTNKSDNNIDVKQGDTILIQGDPEKISTSDVIYVSYKNFTDEVLVGSHILIDDGDIDFIVNEKKNGTLICTANNNGLVKGRKSVNVPKVAFNLPALSNKDIDYINFAVEYDIDFIAHSFVRNKKDILAIQEILYANNSNVKIIAKIENQQGVDNIDEILDHTYGIMVTRGDLAIEIPYEKIPAIQKLLINKCISKRKAVIVATQMMHSMIENPRPTRAEVSDVANAIYSKTDAIMLSGETAYGKYPVETVKTMARIAREVEKSRGPIHDIPVVIINNEISAYLIKAAVEASLNLKCSAIVADSLSGRTIRGLAAYRGRNIVLAQCYDKRIMRELALSFGVYADYMEPRDTAFEFKKSALNRLIQDKWLKLDDRVIIIAGNYGKSLGASFIEISSVKNLKGVKVD